MKSTLFNITKYFGFLTVFIEWLGLIICLLIHKINWAEPASQFGFYSSTKIIFGITFTLAAAAYYIFSFHLNKYWEYSSLTGFLAGFCFILVGWSPYQPYVRGFVFDIHNVMLVTSIFLYSLPMYFIGYKKVHERMALFSRILFWVLTVVAVTSAFSRRYDFGIIYLQLLTLLCAHIWLIIVNTLLINHQKELGIKESILL